MFGKIKYKVNSPIGSSQVEHKIVCLLFASIILLRDASGTVFVVRSACRHPMSPFLAPVPCRFDCYFFSLNICWICLKRNSANRCLHWLLEVGEAADPKGDWKMHFSSPPFSFIAPWACPPSSPTSSLVPCVKVSGAILASLDLCGSEWETAAAAEAAVCSTLIELPGLEGFLLCWVLRLICSRSFVIKSFQPSCLLVWMLNYWRRGEWFLLDLGIPLGALYELTCHLVPSDCWGSLHTIHTTFQNENKGTHNFT